MTDPPPGATRPQPAVADSPHDQLEIRCPKLGGQVTFAYCRREAGTLPCSRTVVCWQACFPVESFLRCFLDEAQWELCFLRPPKAKLASLLELIEAARQPPDPDQREET